MKTADEPPQPKTRAERFAQQRRLHLRRKAKLKAQPKTVTPGISPELASALPKAHTPKAAFSNPSPAMPGFNEQTKAKFDLAVRALKAKGRSLNQRLLICHFHLRFDPVLSGIDPRELLKELNSQN
jgi:hypothetical protein